MGYMEKRKHQKRENTLISLIIFLLTLFTFIPFLAHLDWKFDFFGEIRFYYITVSLLLIIYCLGVRKWTFALLGLLIIIANAAIIYAHSGRPFNQKSEEINGENFAMLLYTQDKKAKDYQELQNILATYNPDIALIFAKAGKSGKLPEQINKNYPYSKKLLTGKKKETIIISSRPFEASGNLSDNDGVIAPWITVLAAGRPISIAAANIATPWKKAKDYKNASRTVLALAEFSKSRDEPTILAGNFAASAGSELLRPLSSLAELRALEGIQPVYPAFLPVFLRFTPKHVYAHPGIVAESVERLSESESRIMPMLLKVKVLKEQ